MKFRIAALLALAFAGPLTAQEPLRLGLTDSFVKDLSPGQKKFLDTEFSGMVKDFSGQSSVLFQGGDPDTAVKKLTAGDWNLAILEGVEFAWMRAKNKNLEPLMIAVFRQRDLKAVLVGKKDGGPTGFADLNGKDLSVLNTKQHMRLFAKKATGAKIANTLNGEGALDAILLGKAVAAVVDNVTLNTYKEINPGRFNRLKILAESETFPAGVIVYNKGSVKDDVLSTFKSGVLKANDSERGRDSMATFKISRFEEVPANYMQLVEAIVKSYPEPTK